MTLKEYQLSICAMLTADTTLAEGGCVAVAEDALDVDAAVAQQLIDGVALIVMTPSVNVIGGGTPGSIPVQIPDLTISCAEIVATNRERPGAMTALQAAERVAWLMDSHAINFKSISQAADEMTSLLTATVIFQTVIYLSQPTPQ